MSRQSSVTGGGRMRRPPLVQQRPSPPRSPLALLLALALLLGLLGPPLPLAAAVVITAPAHLRGRTFPAMPAEFGFTMDTEGARGALRLPAPASSNYGCAQLPAGALNGTIAMVGRGKCTFHKKAAVLRKAGAVGMIVVNNIKGGQLFAMTDDTTDRDSTLPAVLVSDESGAFLEARAAEEAQLGESVQLAISLACTTTYNYGVAHSCHSDDPSEWKAE